MTMRYANNVLKEIPVPKFFKLINESNSANSKKPSYSKDIIEDVFDVSVERGLNDEECSLLLHLFCKGCFSVSDKLKLLQNIVPEKKVPENTIQEFMFWFMFNFKKEKVSVGMCSRILDWIIGLLEHNLADSNEIYHFYSDFYDMLSYAHLVPSAAKLLCKLTKPDDVTIQTVMTVNKALSDPSNKYLLALLNVFKGYKPHLMVEEVKKVDVFKVLQSVRQTMDSVMRVRVIYTRAPQMQTKALGIQEVQTKNFSYFKEELNKISSLIPLPTYNLEGMDKFGACYPNSIDQAFRKFSRVPIPQNIMSLMHNDTGFFMITYQRLEVQVRFQNSLLQTLQNALIFKELKTCEEDVEFLLRRVYCLQAFMQQGIPCVSVFLSGYLLNWDGVDHRYNILRLIEWATFHSFRDLASNILRALHLQFVTNNANMKREIIKTLINLISNMFGDVSRVQLGVPFTFTKRGPKWTRDPESMLGPLIAWTQNLISLGLSIEGYNAVLLMEAINFYQMISVLEVSSGLEMFTVVPEGVVLQSLLSQDPNAIITICRLLHRYHKEILPQLRINKPTFYEQCKEKISLTSNHAQQIIYCLQNGQVVLPRKEHGIIIRDLQNESLAVREEPFNLMCHLCFVSTYLTFESKKNFLDLSESEDRRTSLQLAAFHLREINEFIKFFSPSEVSDR